jgi:hypothetical protein
MKSRLKAQEAREEIQRTIAWLISLGYTPGTGYAGMLWLNSHKTVCVNNVTFAIFNN